MICWQVRAACPTALHCCRSRLACRRRGRSRRRWRSSLLAGALGSYAWVRRAFGDWAGLLAAVVYVLWPLNLAAAYVHGAFADTVFIGLAPWVLWSAAPARQDSDLAPQRRGDGQDTNFALHYVVLALGIAGLLWVRVGLGLWFAAVVLAYLLIANRSRLSLLAWIAGLVLGMLGLIPLLVGRGLGAGAAGDFVSQLIDPYRLFSAGPGLATGASRGGSAVYELGLVALGLAVLTLVLPAGDHNPRSRQTARLAGLLVIVATLLSTTLSGTLWRLLPGFSRTLAHPWELLLLAGPWLAWLAASAVARLYRTALGSARLPLAAAMLALVVLGLLPLSGAAVNRRGCALGPGRGLWGGPDRVAGRPHRVVFRRRARPSQPRCAGRRSGR